MAAVPWLLLIAAFVAVLVVAGASLSGIQPAPGFGSAARVICTDQSFGLSPSPSGTGTAGADIILFAFHEEGKPYLKYVNGRLQVNVGDQTALYDKAEQNALDNCKAKLESLKKGAGSKCDQLCSQYQGSFCTGLFVSVSGECSITTCSLRLEPTVEELEQQLGGELRDTAAKLHVDCGWKLDGTEMCHCFPTPEAESLRPKE